jgi:predicted MFS family arabinose efflux permease
MIPLEHEFGWSRTAISTAIAINILLFGLIGPFAAALIDRWGLRLTISLALLTLAASVALTTQMTKPWHMTVIWGVLVGSATGFTAMVLAAIVANRWFEHRRGLVTGMLSAANATGQLIFLPLLATLIQRYGWRSGALLIASVALAVFVPAAIFLRDRPSDLGLDPYGGPAPAPRNAMKPIQALQRVWREPPFWLLAGSFFVCGASTNGLIGTHLIPACHDYGIPEIRAAGLLALMGIFDIAGATASGWLTDRFPPRNLLAIYYALRGLSLLFLPYTLAQGHSALNWFALFYGLDWIATVPPTVRLTADSFGRENAGVIYGWIGAAHQLGASFAAWGAGYLRTEAGSYQGAFWTSAALCLFTALLFKTPWNKIFKTPSPC